MVGTFLLMVHSRKGKFSPPPRPSDPNIKRLHVSPKKFCSCVFSRYVHKNSLPKDFNL